MARETLVVPHVHKLANLAEVPASVRATAVEVALVHNFEALCGERSDICLTHDLLADMVDAVP